MVCRLFVVRISSTGNMLSCQLQPRPALHSYLLSPICQRNNSPEGTCSTAPIHGMPGQSCTVARERKAATCGVEGKATGWEKGDEDSCRICFGNSCGFPSLHGSGKMGGKDVTEV